MLESVKAVNFQSLQNLDLELGKFTVIVGPSSSGKSALTRAIRSVTSNALDSDYITRGAKVASVSIRTNDYVVTIEREQGGSSAYKIAEASGKESSFTKLNRQVPSEVTEALGISPDTKEVTSINFASQFDTPYLLKEGSSSVARVLGELTNVSTIFSAVREASKRAKGASSVMNLRKKDQEKLLAQMSQYTSVVAEAKVVGSLEQQLVQCQELQDQIADLTRLENQLSRATGTLEAIKEIPSQPDLAPLLEAHKKLLDFKQLVRSFATASKVIVESDNKISQVKDEIALIEQQLHDTLVKAGKCPTCNQTIES